MEKRPEAGDTVGLTVQLSGLRSGTPGGLSSTSI